MNSYYTETRNRLKDAFPQRFLKLLGDKSIAVFCADTGISKTQITAWLKKRSYPKQKPLLSICNYFNCKPSYFLDVDC